MWIGCSVARPIPISKSLRLKTMPNRAVPTRVPRNAPRARDEKLTRSFGTSALAPRGQQTPNGALAAHVSTRRVSLERRGDMANFRRSLKAKSTPAWGRKSTSRRRASLIGTYHPETRHQRRATEAKASSTGWPPVPLGDIFSRRNAAESVGCNGERGA